MFFSRLEKAPETREEGELLPCESVRVRKADRESSRENFSVPCQESKRVEGKVVELRQNQLEDSLNKEGVEPELYNNRFREHEVQGRDK